MATALDSRLLHGPAVDQIFADEDATGAVYWALADNQGSVRDVIDSSGNKVTHFKYGAFGNITAVEDGSGNPSTFAAEPSTHFLYTGREWDADAELYYYRARWYDPAVGRFISEDPIGFGRGCA